MSDFINTIDVLVDDAVIDSIIDRSITEFNDDKIKEMGRYALYKCTALTELNLPNAEMLDGHSCEGCTSLTSVYLPSATKLNGENFCNCTALTSVYVPNVTYIGKSGGTDGYNVFANCDSLVNIVLPKVESVPVATFQHCEVLERIDLPVATKIENSFRYSFNLNTLILRNETIVCTLTTNLCLTDSKIKRGTGYIYVPRALIEDYKVATNWSTYATQFRALEDYTVDGTTTGELDETKI